MAQLQKYQEGMGDDPTPFKKPNGERCGICGLSYSAFGMAAQHGKMAEYKKNVIERNTIGNQAIHKTFLLMHQSWIKEYNQERRSTAAVGKKFLRRLSANGQLNVKARYVEVRKTVKLLLPAVRKTSSRKIFGMRSRMENMTRARK